MFSAVGIGLKLLGIGQALGRTVRGMVRWTLSDIRHAAIVALLAALAVLWLQNSGLRSAVQKATWREAGWKQFAYDTGYASGKARAAQIAMNKAVTDKQITIERLNRETSLIRNAAIRDASSRYADNNRLSKVCPAYSSGADPAAQDRDPQGNDGVQAGAIVVSERDFNVSNDRTADAIRYEEWARALVAAGLAVEAE